MPHLKREERICVEDKSVEVEEENSRGREFSQPTADGTSVEYVE